MGSVSVITPDSNSPHLDSAVLPAGFQPQHPQRLWYDKPLLAIIRGRNTFEKFETLKGSRTAGGLVRYHATDRSVEDLRRRAVMEGAGLFRVNDVSFMQEIVVPELLVSCNPESTCRSVLGGERPAHR
jgi:hypothetical protein